MTRLLLVSACILALTACGTPHSQQVRTEAHDRYDRANAQVVYDQSLQSFHAGQFELALNHIDKAISRFPKDGSYELLKGRILLEMKRVDLARESFVKAATLSPTLADPHYFLGIVLQRWNELDKAADEYAKAFELAPSQLQYVAAECETLIAANRLDDAEARLNAVNHTFEFSPVLDRIRADLAEHRGNLPQREKWLLAARMRTDPDKSQQLMEEIAAVQFEQGDWTGCLAALEDEGLKSVANRSDLVRLRARCLLMLDRPREARDLMVALRTETDAEGRNAMILGLAAMRLGDTARMIDAGKTLTQTRPASSDGWLMLGIAAMQKGDRAEAARLLGEAATRDPSRELPRKLLAAVATMPGTQAVLGAAQTAP